MNTIIEMHESIIGEFASRKDAEAVGLALVDRGWPVMYSEGSAPRWQFANLAEMHRFQRDFDQVLDSLSRAGSLRVRWGCDCDELQEAECSHGGQQEEMTPARIRREVEATYPGFAGRVEALVQSLYNAVWFGKTLESLTGETSATGLFLRSGKWQAPAGTDVKQLDVAAALFDFAEHDAAFEAMWSGAGHELEELERLPRCRTCDGWLAIGCRCEGAA